MPTIVVVQSVDSSSAANLPDVAEKLLCGAVFMAEANKNISDTGVWRLLDSPDLTIRSARIGNKSGSQIANGWWFLIRGHWVIANGLHWRRDAIWREHSS